MLNKTKVYLYTRVSTLMQVDGYYDNIEETAKWTMAKGNKVQASNH